MNSKMTPCEKLGYKVGDKFKVVDGTGVLYAVGSFITLIHDDGTSCPRFNGVHATYESGDSFFPLDSVEKVAKLKPAKQALADAIHQNGGWPIEVHWLFSTSSRVGAISFWVCRPKFNSTDWFEGGSRCVTIMLNRCLPNWHQTILSREEYYHAYPKADADGWIEWKGGMKSPVESGVPVDVKTKDGNEHYDQLLGDACWHNNWGDANIIAYRLHKPEVKPDFCESVMRSIPEPESIDGLCAKVTEENKHQHVDAKPTIEQLAQDYRTKLDYSSRKQQEADDAKAAADAALGELERAGEALGLLIGIAKPDHEPELVITDWRHLQKGDIVWWSGDSKYSSGEYPVHDIEEHHHTGSCAILLDVGYYCRQWIDHDEEDWKFIRRP